MAKRLKYTGVCLLGIGVAATGVGCETGAPPFKPRVAQEAERSLARENAPTRNVPLPTTLQSNYLPPTQGPDGTVRRAAPTTNPATGPQYRPEDVRRMTLQEVIRRAVLNNPDVRAVGFDPAIEQTRIVEAEANFDPTLFTNFQYEQRDDESAGIQSITGRVRDWDFLRRWQAAGGVRQNLESGGQIELRQQFVRTFQNPDRTVINPFYESQLVLEVTQPILRNFGSVINRARIDIARNNTRISVLDFRNTLEETLLRIEQAYWQLVGAERDVSILERQLQRTENTADLLLKRWGQDVSRVQTSQTAASVEARRAELVLARARVKQLSINLKRLMGDPSLPISGPEIVLPASTPITEQLKFDAGEQVDAAMNNRFDLAQQLLRIEAAGIVYRVAQNNLLPALNLIGGIGSQSVDADGEQAWYGQNSFDNLNYRVGFQFEIPIGNRAANAIMKRSKLQRQQAIAQYEQARNAAAEEVASALNKIDYTWQQSVASRAARFAAEDALNALQEREDRGEPLTADFVNRKLQAQEQLTDQEQRENAALMEYQAAIAELERAKGTLLRYNNVQMAEQPLPYAYRPNPAEPKLPVSKSMYPDVR